MKVFLMHPDADFDLGRKLPAHEATLTQDLELSTLIAGMAAGDPLLAEVATRALLLGLDDPEEITYRQEVLTDSLENGDVVRRLYALAGDAIESEKKVWGGYYRDSPGAQLHTSIQKMELLVPALKQLRALAADDGPGFRSPGFTRLFAMILAELTPDYFARIESYLKQLKFDGGMLLSAQLIAGNKGGNYVLRRQREQGWLERLFDRSGLSFTIADRDEAGFAALRRLQDRGTNTVADAVAQSLEHVLSFFVMLRSEVGFYVACLNLRERLASKGEPTAMPTARPRGEAALDAVALYDVSLAISLESRVVGNDLRGDGKALVMITGANQGGKSTFLRSIGLAQLMMQAGMFVGAEAFRANVRDGVFTHFKREEDTTMESGKLDEELARMSQIADQIRPGSMLLCNESFASTNEREGSEIARQVVRAMLSEGVEVLFVTHMFDLANGLYLCDSTALLFLRAERGEDGARPFKLREGEPLPTSFAQDSYQRVFGRILEVP
jgi:hypothetical protein